MSLLYRYDEAEPVVLTACTAGLVWSGYYPQGQFHGCALDHDLLVQHLMTWKLFCHSGARTVSSILGWASPYQKQPYEVVSHKVWYPTEIIDIDRNYRNIYDNFRTFYGVFSGRSFTAPSTYHEKNMRHASYSGELTSSTEGIDLTPSSYEFYGYFVDIRDNHDNIINDVYCTSVSPLLFTPVSHNYSGGSRYCLTDLLDYLISLGSVVNIAPDPHGGNICVRTISGIHYTLSMERVMVSWHSELVDLIDNHSYTWDSEYVLEFPSIPYSGVSSIGGPFRFLSTASQTFRLTNGKKDGIVFDDSSFEFSGQYGSGFHLLSLDGGTTSTSRNESRGVTIEQMRSKRFLQVFEDACYDNLFDIASSCIHSTVAAFKNLEDSVNPNVLQSLSKLPEISEQLPRIREAVEVLSSLVKRDLSYHTLKSIFDLATSTKLSADFTWRPYLDLLTNYLPIVLTSIQSLGIRNSERAIGYGSFRFQIINHLGRKAVNLRTRTKLVMDTRGNSLLSSITQVDALGLLPKASNLWDLLPFTFVVNWFTSVGQSIRRAEYSLLLATIPAYYVHTYTLTSPLTDEELDLLKASNASSEDPVLRVYIRDVTLCTPYPRNDPFGFGLPTQLPSLGTVGSLLYQLIFN